MSRYFKGATHLENGSPAFGKIHRGWFYAQFDCWGAECQRNWRTLRLDNLWHGRLLPAIEYPVECGLCNKRDEPPEQYFYDGSIDLSGWYAPANTTELMDRAQGLANDLTKVTHELISLLDKAWMDR